MCIGFIFKGPTTLLAKGKQILAMLSLEKWFSLSLSLKYIANIYQTYVRSGLLYGSELLNKQERRPLEDIDDELVRTYIKGFLKLKNIIIPQKHKNRILLIFKLPTMRMEMEQRCLTRVETWSKRTVDERKKVAFHAQQSIQDIKKLQHDHPLQEALGQVCKGDTAKKQIARQWKQLEKESKGSNDSSSRHITGQDETNNPKDKNRFPKFLADTELDPTLKRAMLRWTIYKFPVRYKPNIDERQALEEIKHTNQLSDTEYGLMVEKVKKLFNEEQEWWGLWKLRKSYTQDIRSRYRI